MFVKFHKLAQLLYSTKQLLFCLHACPFKKSPQEHHFPQNIGIMRRPMCIPGNPFCLEHNSAHVFAFYCLFPVILLFVLLFSLSTVINFFSFCVSSFLLYCTMFTFCKIMFFLIFPALFMFIKFMDTLKGQISQQIILIIRCCTYKQANINFEYNH